MRLRAREVVEHVARTVRQMGASVWQEGESERSEAVDTSITQANEAGEIGDEDSLWVSTRPWGQAENDRRHEDNDHVYDKEGGLHQRADAVDQGMNWVSKDYMQLFSHAEEERAVVSYLSNASSYIGSDISSFSSANKDSIDITSESDWDNSKGRDSTGDPVASDSERHVTDEGSTAATTDPALPYSDSSERKESGKRAKSPEGSWWRWFDRGVRGRRQHSSGGITSDAFSSFSSSQDQFLVFTSKASTSTSSLWGWVEEDDELRREIRTGQAFADFREGPLTFPPSFRWRRGGCAGDFSDAKRMADAYVLVKKGDGERVPSYTDRILFHSLSDVRCYLRLIAYRMCEHVRGSDHRPVSAAFQLTVNRRRIGFRLDSPEAGTVSPETPMDYAGASTWRVQLSRARYTPYCDQPSLVQGNPPRNVSTFKERASPCSSSHPTGTPSVRIKGTSSSNFVIGAQTGWKVTVYFPCVLEDPFAADAKIQDLEKALLEEEDDSGIRRVRDQIRRAVDSRGMQRCHRVDWGELAGSQGLTFDVLVLPEVSRHALVRIVEPRTGVEVGQGVICLRQAFVNTLPAGTSASLRARKWVRAVWHRTGQVPPEGVELLISKQGKAVGKMHLQLKIRRHKDC